MPSKHEPASIAHRFDSYTLPPPLFISDYCATFVKSFQFSGGTATNTQTWPTLQPAGSVSSFGQDARGELYILTLNGGVYRIVPGP